MTDRLSYGDNFKNCTNGIIRKKGRRERKPPERLLDKLMRERRDEDPYTLYRGLKASGMGVYPDTMYDESRADWISEDPATLYEEMKESKFSPLEKTRRQGNEPITLYDKIMETLSCSPRICEWTEIYGWNVPALIQDKAKIFLVIAVHGSYVCIEACECATAFFESNPGAIAVDLPKKNAELFYTFPTNIMSGSINGDAMYDIGASRTFIPVYSANLSLRIVTQFGLGLTKLTAYQHAVMAENKHVHTGQAVLPPWDIERSACDNFLDLFSYFVAQRSRIYKFPFAEYTNLHDYNGCMLFKLRGILLIVKAGTWDKKGKREGIIKPDMYTVTISSDDPKEVAFVLVSMTELKSRFEITSNHGTLGFLCHEAWRFSDPVYGSLTQGEIVNKFNAFLKAENEKSKMTVCSKVVLKSTPHDNHTCCLQIQLADVGNEGTCHAHWECSLHPYRKKCTGKPYQCSGCGAGACEMKEVHVHTTRIGVAPKQRLCTVCIILMEIIDNLCLSELPKGVTDIHEVNELDACNLVRLQQRLDTQFALYDLQKFAGVILGIVDANPTCLADIGNAMSDIINPDTRGKLLEALIFYNDICNRGGGCQCQPYTPCLCIASNANSFRDLCHKLQECTCTNDDTHAKDGKKQNSEQLADTWDPEAYLLFFLWAFVNFGTVQDEKVQLTRVEMEKMRQELVTRFWAKSNMQVSYQQEAIVWIFASLNATYQSNSGLLSWAMKNKRYDCKRKLNNLATQ